MSYALLSSAQVYDPRTGQLTNQRAEELWIENYERATKAAVERDAAQSATKEGQYAKLYDVEAGEPIVEVVPDFGVRTFFDLVGFRELRIRWSALVHPLLNASSKNRLVLLLKWDFAMFALWFSLLYVCVYYALRAEEVDRAELAGEPVNEFAAIWPLLDGSMWGAWQCQITFSV